MKRLVFTMALVVFGTALMAQSPGFRAGTRIGIGNAVFISENQAYENQIGKIAFQAGVSGGQQFTNNFGLEIDGLLHFRGAKYTDSEQVSTFGGEEDFTQIVRTLYVDVPILAKVSFGTSDFRVKGYAGPSINFLLYAEEERKFDDPDVDRNNGYINDISSFQTNNLGYVYGIGLETETTGGSIFYVDFRVQEDLRSAGNYNGESFKQRVVGLSVGSKFMR